MAGGADAHIKVGVFVDGLGDGLICGVVSILAGTSLALS